MSLVGLIGLPVVATILWQSRVLVDQSRPEHAPMSGRALLMTRPMLLFFGFYLLGSMAGGGVQAWIVTVLHDVNGLDIAIGSSALTGYMVGNTGGVLVGGWFADRAKRLALITIALTTISATLTFLVGVLPLGGVAAITVLFVSGVALGASRTPRDIMVKDAAPPGQIGKVFGFVSAGLPLGSAAHPGPVRLPDRPWASGARAGIGLGAADGEPAVHGHRPHGVAPATGTATRRIEEPRMAQIAIVYHTGYGHTAKQAEAVHAGMAGATATLYKIDAEGHLPDGTWEALAAADAIVFGTPTYMGGPSWQFKRFADASSKPWFSLA